MKWHYITRAGRVLLLPAVVFMAACSPGYSQETLPPAHYWEKLAAHYTQAREKLHASSQKLLHKLRKRDSTANRWYEKAQMAAVDTLPAQRVPIAEYHSVLDSVQTGLVFLSTHATSLPAVSAEQLAAVQASYSQLQTAFNRASSLKAFIQERQAAWKQLFTPRQVKQLKAQAYYYHQQVQGYRDMLINPDKLQARLLTVLRETPAFHNFFLQHSYLSSLYPAAAATSGAAVIEGLQTRTEVLNQVNTVLGNTGAAAANSNPFNSLSAQASGEVANIRKELNKLGSAGAAVDMPPGFTPNRQKTRSFWKRMEYGFNLQSQPHTSLLPSITELALTAGYRLNNNNVAGLGIAYKQGWGSPFRKIQLSSEGVGLRAFIDKKMYKSFYLSGGYEKNYLSTLRSIADLPNIHAWQSSGLLGLTKKYQFGSKTANMQLLWDFLSYAQQPRSQAIKFRIGYAL